MSIGLEVSTQVYSPVSGRIFSKSVMMRCVDILRIGQWRSVGVGGAADVLYSIELTIPR